MSAALTAANQLPQRSSRRRGLRAIVTVSAHIPSPGVSPHRRDDSPWHRRRQVPATGPLLSALHASAKVAPEPWPALTEKGSCVSYAHPSALGAGSLERLLDVRG